MALALLIALLLTPVLSFEGIPTVCLDPHLELQAGISHVSMVIDKSRAEQCLASVYFDDLSLPIMFTFQSSSCDDLELASFQMPRSVPSGNATITWQCAGQVPSCSRALIVNGLANSSLGHVMDGQVSCISESLQSSTLATTETKASSTIVKTLVSLVTITSTVPITSGTTSYWQALSSAPACTLGTTSASESSIFNVTTVVGSSTSDFSIRKSFRYFSNSTMCNSTTAGSTFVSSNLVTAYEPTSAPYPYSSSGQGGAQSSSTQPPLAKTPTAMKLEEVTCTEIHEGGDQISTSLSHSQGD
ncbi:hypothetical protein JX265_013708 [Neoarthrinium moseri]|uniref:Uncharacterized protein n=1 Tax=Neoarthrinium moseri TaxID=1658444 RepID=A0A9Q0AIG3_9PEZI|nr:hypothetical protein JX266_012095 [Neoarthrinium moseri]KAI1849011.1 hypothetical protein JX265_013708 [Neoarthrinium moseri]